MPALLDTKFVEEIAFAWSGTTRVFECDSLQVFGAEDMEDWQVSNGTLGYNTQGVWLEFQVFFRWAQRISPSASAGNDLKDVRNAIRDPSVDVSFYPIYDVDATVSYIVIPSGDRSLLAEIQRIKNIPSYSMLVRADTRLASEPEWLNNTRLK